MKPSPSAKNVSGNSGNFVDFARRILQVPHSEIKAKLEAEKAEKRTRHRRSASRSSDASSKQDR